MYGKIVQHDMLVANNIQNQLCDWNSQEATLKNMQF